MTPRIVFTYVLVHDTRMIFCPKVKVRQNVGIENTGCKCVRNISFFSYTISPKISSIELLSTSSIWNAGKSENATFRLTVSRTSKEKSFYNTICIIDENVDDGQRVRPRNRIQLELTRIHLHVRKRGLYKTFFGPLYRTSRNIVSRSNVIIIYAQQARAFRIAAGYITR